jgi:opacity protein-like surface antigen
MIPFVRRPSPDDAGLEVSMRRPLILAAFAVLAFAQPAAAADMPAYGSAIAAPMGGMGMDGWYLRGDIGYVLPMRPTGDGLLPGGLTRTFENERFGKSMMVGLGVGYKFNNWFRADVTAEWRKNYQFHATNSGTGYVDGYSDERARFSARTLMLNGYVDLGTWSGFTPYVGAGMGVTTNELKGWTTQVFCYTALCTPSGPALTIPDTRKSGFTWALMAGTAIEITPNLSLDVGYRFLHLGAVTTGTDAFGVGAKIGAVKINEVKAGLRYKFN